MSLRKMAMMLTIMLITILSASCFYVLTEETDSGGVLVTSSTDGDYEKVYELGAPYGTEGHKYYIRYTGAATGRTVVDLKDETAKNTNGDTVDTGLTIGEDGYPYIFGQKITSTYKMFSYRSGKTNTEITRVFIPTSLAIDADKDTGVLQDDGTYKYADNVGIVSNTFSGYEQSKVEKDVIYHTGSILTGDETKDARGEGVTALLDRTNKISKSTYRYVTTYVYLGAENVCRTSKNDYGKYSYSGKVKNVFVGNDIDYPGDYFTIIIVLQH